MKKLLLVTVILSSTLKANSYFTIGGGYYQPSHNLDSEYIQIDYEPLMLGSVGVTLWDDKWYGFSASYTGIVDQIESSSKAYDIDFTQIVFSPIKTRLLTVSLELYNRKINYQVSNISDTYLHLLDENNNGTNPSSFTNADYLVLSKNESVVSEINDTYVLLSYGASKESLFPTGFGFGYGVYLFGRRFIIKNANEIEYDDLDNRYLMQVTFVKKDEEDLENGLNVKYFTYTGAIAYNKLSFGMIYKGTSLFYSGLDYYVEYIYERFRGEHNSTSYLDNSGDYQDANGILGQMISTSHFLFLGVNFGK
jgi:hypothetical protein